jgi:hypothetical protein
LARIVAQVKRPGADRTSVGWAGRAHLWTDHDLPDHDLPDHDGLATALA